MRRLSVLVVALVLAAGCSDDGPEPEKADASTKPSSATEPPRPPKVLSVPKFRNAGYGERSTIGGCASVGHGQDWAPEDEGYTKPVLLWFRIRTTAPVRLLPPTYAPRSNSIDSVTSYLGPDPGPEAPNAAVSVGEVGEGPTAARERYDTHLIGDQRHSAKGLAAARKSWAERVGLRDDRGVKLDPGDHYLFVEVDPQMGMDLHGLTARWTHAGTPGQQYLGSLSLRVQCGG